MNVVPLENADMTLPDLAALARTGTVILTRNGKPLAAVRHLSQADWESVSLADNPRFREIIAESRRAFQREGGIGLEDLRKELGLKPAKPKRPKKKKKP